MINNDPLFMRLLNKSQAHINIKFPGIRDNRRKGDRGRGRTFRGVFGGEEGADREVAEGDEPAAPGGIGKGAPQLQGDHQGVPQLHAGGARGRHALIIDARSTMRVYFLCARALHLIWFKGDSLRGTISKF